MLIDNSEEVTMTMTRTNAQVAGIYLLAIVGSALFMVIPHISVWSGLIKAPSALGLWAASFMTLFTQWWIFAKTSRYLHEWGTSSCGPLESYAQTTHAVILIIWSWFLLSALVSILAVSYNHLKPWSAWNISAIALVVCAPEILVQFIFLLRGK